MKCRHCNAPLSQTFLDLGFAPPSNAYLTRSFLEQPEKYFPLKVRVCDQCFLVQTEDYSAANELFQSDYAYFSSTSTSWLEHAQQYSNFIIHSLKLDSSSKVIEIASNDGYLLKNFVSAGIPCLGIEPTSDTANAAVKLGVPVIREFFGESLANDLSSNGETADLVIGNNVYAHVPDINDFTRGLKRILKPSGTITLEFPHLMKLIEYSQFDTIYHEHFSYLSLYSLIRIFSSCGLRVYDVHELSTHGGSLRVFGCHSDDPRPSSSSVCEILNAEANTGLQSISSYQDFQLVANRVKDDLLEFLINCKKTGKTVAAYGAAAKGNTLLNYAGIKPDLIPFVCDAAISKQNKFMPGSHIPILPPSALYKYRPNYILILPWNLSQEIVKSNVSAREWDAKFVTAVPCLRIF